jgi:hypothetical protein
VLGSEIEADGSLCARELVDDGPSLRGDHHGRTDPRRVREHNSRTTSDGGLAKGQCIGPRGTIFPDLLRLAVVAGAQAGVMSNRTILWLLAMIVGLGLLFWLFPPHEIERRLEREKMGARQSRGS